MATKGEVDMVKKSLSLICCIFLVSCVHTEEDTNRICVDYGSYTFIKEKCIPMYGALICADEEVTRVYCKRYDTLAPTQMTGKKIDGKSSAHEDICRAPAQ